LNETNDQAPAGAAVPQAVDEPGRREALLKIGKYGAYVAPAVLALIVGNKAEAVCSCS
jgi:hypothetical protein